MGRSSTSLRILALLLRSGGLPWLAFRDFQRNERCRTGLGGPWIPRPISLHRAYARPVADEREKQALGCAGFILVDEPCGRHHAARLLHLETRHCRHSWTNYRLDHLYPQFDPHPSVAQLMGATRTGANNVFIRGISLIRFLVLFSVFSPHIVGHGRWLATPPP